MHALCHLADDVKNFGTTLNEISGFSFENHLQKIKKSVRTAQNPIAQISKRLTELENARCRRIPKKLHLFTSTRKKDSCFMLKNNRIAFIKEKRDDRKYVCEILSRRSLGSFFSNPSDSRLINVYFVASRREVHHRTLVEHNDLLRKMVCIPCEGGNVLVPMLHGIER